MHRLTTEFGKGVNHGTKDQPLRCDGTLREAVDGEALPAYDRHGDDQIAEEAQIGRDPA